MKVHSALAYLLSILSSFVMAMPAAYAAVGRTPGTFAVSATGAATYTIPISAPQDPMASSPTLPSRITARPGSVTSESVGVSRV
jgi:hypothetical protein